MKRNRIIMLLLALAAVMLFSSCMVTKDMVRTIEVSATAEVALSADIASFSIQVSEMGDTTKDAQALTNAKMSAILGVLRSYQIDEADMSTTALSLRPSYSWVGNEQILDGQVASQSLKVVVRDLPALAPLIDSLGEISGITLNSVTLDKEDKSEALVLARQQAVALALEKAEIYAQSSSMRVGSPIALSEASTATAYEARPMKMMVAGAYDMATEIPAGTMTVRSTISLLVEMFPR